MGLSIKTWKYGLGCVFISSFVGIVYFGYYYCSGSKCALRGGSIPIPVFKSNFDAYFAGRYLQNEYSQGQLEKEFDIDIDNEDIIVFLHIQKTGGSTFGNHLVENLKVDPPCHCYRKVKKHCDCFNKKRKIWLFSRFSTGWRCGLHADWTELKSCVDNYFQETYGRKKRRYYYITMLRDPVWRFVSEWMHVQRGATWKTAALKCNGREATLDEVPFCHKGKNWRGVTLQQFLACPHNLAFNRQTRMLANLSRVNCYNTSGWTPAARGREMLRSAKQNLLDFAFFGLLEFQAFSQLLFESALHMRFIHRFTQSNATRTSTNALTPRDLRRIAEMNSLDIELYQFAKDLFLQRVKRVYRDRGLTLPSQLDGASVAAVKESGAAESNYSVGVEREEAFGGFVGDKGEREVNNLFREEGGLEKEAGAASKVASQIFQDRLLSGERHDRGFGHKKLKSRLRKKDTMT